MASTGQVLTASSNVPPPNPPPPIHAADYVTRALFLSIAVFVVALGLIIWKRGLLTSLKRNVATFHYFVEISEWVLAIAISIVVGFFELYKMDTWNNAKPSLIGSASLLAVIIACYLGAKGISAAAKKRDADEISELKKANGELEGDVAQANQARGVIESQRDQLLEISALVRKVVDSKMDRMVTALGGRHDFQAAEIVSALDPKEQISIIIKTIFVYFDRKKKADAQLRLGIYQRDPSSPRTLKRIYSWDGTRDNCFHREGRDLGFIDDPQGIATQLIGIFHSTKPIRIIESCAKAESMGQFQYFPGQQGYLKSMVLYKHVFDDNGTRDALILTLDASEDGLFREKDEQEMCIFFLEMMKRVEFELKCVDTLLATPEN